MLARNCLLCIFTSLCVLKIEGNKRNACFAELEVKIDVREGDDAILPCSFHLAQDITGKVFDWKKDERKEVFLYSDGPQYNKGRSGQDPQFTGRVTHFPDELKHGNASIKIHNTTMADRGTYTCVFPHDNLRKSTIRLLVGKCFHGKPVIRPCYVAIQKSILKCFF